MASKSIAAAVAAPAVKGSKPAAAKGGNVVKITSKPVKGQPAPAAVTLQPGVVQHIAPSLIHVQEGYNVRMFDAVGNEDDKGLVASIRATKGVETPLTVRSENGRLIVVAGHRRLAAVQHINANGGTIASVPVLAERAENANDIARTFDLIVSNSGKPLTPVELGNVVLRLRAQGVRDAFIAEKAGKTDRYLRMCAVMATAPESIRSLIYNETVASTLAHDVIQAAGVRSFDAEKVLLKAVERARANGKDAATLKNVDAVLTEMGFGTLKTPAAPAPVQPAAPAAPATPAAPDAPAPVQPGTTPAEPGRPAGTVTPGGAVAAGKPAAVAPASAGKPAAPAVPYTAVMCRVLHGTRLFATTTTNADAVDCAAAMNAMHGTTAPAAPAPVQPAPAAPDAPAPAPAAPAAKGKGKPAPAPVQPAPAAPAKGKGKPAK